MSAPGSDLPELAGLLRCLACSHELRAAGNFPQELGCTSCGAVYPVVDSTPRLLPRGPADPQKDRTAASFAYEWDRFGALRQEWHKNFIDYLRPLTPDDLRDKLVLDVGAGSGRHSVHAAAAGAHVVAVDLGDSIDVARRNLPAAVLTVQADADLLPFAPDVFDIVMSLGVLHHLTDPEATLQRIVRHARPGGRVHVYLYWVPEHRWHRVVLGAVSTIRRLTTRLPHRLLHALCYPIAVALFLVFVAPHRTLRRHPRLRSIAAGFPLKTYADYSFGVLVNDQFDRFSAPIEHRYTRREVADMLRRAGLEDVVVLGNHGWVADGRRPQCSPPPASR